MCKPRCTGLIQYLTRFGDIKIVYAALDSAVQHALLVEREYFEAAGNQLPDRFVGRVTADILPDCLEELCFGGGHPALIVKKLQIFTDEGLHIIDPAVVEAGLKQDTVHFFQLGKKRIAGVHLCREYTR